MLQVFCFAFQIGLMAGDNINIDKDHQCLHKNTNYINKTVLQMNNRTPVASVRVWTCNNGLLLTKHLFANDHITFRLHGMLILFIS